MGANTTNGYFYKPALGASGAAELALYDAALDATDIIIKANVDAIALRQPLDAGLTSIAALTTAADKMIYTTALDTYAVASLTAFARTILDDADEATFKATVNLEIGTDVQAYDASLTSISALTYVSGSFIALTAADTYTVRTYAQTLTDIGGAATNQTMYIGTTAVAINRGTAALTLAGITLTTPDIGVATATSINKVTITAPATSAILTLVTGSSLITAGAFSITLTSTGTTAVTLPTSGTLITTAVATLSSLTSVGTITTGGLGTGAVLAGVTMTLGSDADGDIYYRTSGVLTRLAKGTDGHYLKQGASIPEWAAVAAGGDVSVSGTPADSQIAVWTNATTIEGAASLTYDGSNLQLTGDIGATGTRITKGWFANLETTGDLTVNGTALASIYATLGANTTITSILNAALYVGRDADNQIKFATDDNIVFRLAGVDGALFNATGELDMGAHSVGFTQQTATGDGTTTIDWRLGNKFTFTFGAQADTFTFTAPTNPCNLILVLIQDATGSRTATFPNTVKWVGGTAPTLTTAANSIDICSFYYDGTNYFGVANNAFAVPA